MFSPELKLNHEQFKIMSQALTDLTAAIQSETDAITALTQAITTIPVGGAGTPDAALVPSTAQARANASNINAAVTTIQAVVTPAPFAS